jgi:hypothetical protein
MKSHPDVNDTLRTGGVDAVRTRHDKAQHITCDPGLLNEINCEAHDFSGALRDEGEPPKKAPTGEGEWPGEGAGQQNSSHGFQWRWHFHGDPDVTEARSHLVQDLIPEVGAGLMSGQWGTYKTFVAFDLAGAVMSGKPFISFPVRRHGGVLFFACEGESEVAIRLQAVVEAKCGPGPAPFGWVDCCPRLLDRNAPKILAAMVKEAADRMLAQFGLPVVLVIVDTAGKAAGYTKVGDENDTVLGQLVMKTLATLAKEARVFVLGVDHFGKSVEVGTRGASSKDPYWVTKASAAPCSTRGSRSESAAVARMASSSRSALK